MPHVVPHDFDAETALLGAMLLNRRALATGVETVSASDFYSAAHQAIFAALATLHAEGKPADLVVVLDRVSAAGVDHQRLLALQAGTPASANAAHYAALVARAAAARRAIRLLDVALARAWDGDPTGVLDLLDHASTDIAAPLDHVDDPIDALDFAGEDHNVDWIVRGLLARHEQVLIVAEPGCLAGDTMLTLNRAGKGFQCSIRDAERMLHGGVRAGKRWDPSIPTTVSRARDGVARRAVVADVWQSGVKTTWTLTTDSGRSIRATADHRFCTPDGFVRLGELAAGDRLCVNRGQGLGRQPRKWYLSVATAYHPRQRRVTHGKFRMWTHRLVMEAHLNGLDLDSYVDALRHDPIRCKEFVYLTSDDVVHHRDENYRNNILSNLELMTHDTHRRYHAADTMRNVLHQIGTETITSIVGYGDEMTYDLAVVDEPHNFLANGFVVHNSGKTTLLNQFAVCCAAGLHPWTRVEMPRQRVLVFDFQDSRGARGRNVQHLIGLTHGRLERGWLFYELRSQGADLTGRADQRWVEAKIAAVRPAIVVAGPLYNMVQGAAGRGKQSEETAQLAGQFLAELAVRYDLALLIEAHAPHGEELRVRGSKYWEDWAGWGLGLRSAMVDGQRSFTLERFRGDREIGRQWPTKYVQGHRGSWPWEVPDRHLPADPTGGTEKMQFSDDNPEPF